MSQEYPFTGRAIMRYKSEEPGDLSFEADERIRVLGPSQDDPTNSSEGETMDRTKRGCFPKEFVGVREGLDDEEGASTATQPASALAGGPSADEQAPIELEAGAPLAAPEQPAAVASKAVPVSIPSAGGTDALRHEIPPVNSPPTEDAAPLAAPLEDANKELSLNADKADVDVPAAPPSTAPVVVDHSNERSASGSSAAASALGEEATKTTPPVSAAAPVSMPTKPVVEPSSTGAVKVGGMSAADAQQTIKSGGSLKDRMAMFQQKANTSAPPPPIPRGKPTGNWAWKNKAAATSPSSESTPPSISASSPPTTTTTTTTTTEESVARPTTIGRAGAMSADDAKEAVTKGGGSLRERMAALQGAGAFGSGAAASPPPPPPSSGKPRVWKRPSIPEPPKEEVKAEKPKSKWVVEEMKPEERERALGEGKPKPVATGETEGEGEGEENGEKKDEEGDAAAEAEGVAAAPAEEEPEEQDEEAAEKARRAAIAARMAKIGARGPMGMMQPPPVAAPPAHREPPAEVANPTEAPKKAAAADNEQLKDDETAVTSPVSETPLVPVAAAGDESNSSVAAPTSAPLKALPKRAAPPRRKANSKPATESASVPAPAAAAASEDEEKEELFPPAPNPSEIPIPKTKEQLEAEHIAEKAGAGKHGAEGAEAAGIALSDPAEGEQVEDQPLVGSEEAEDASAAPAAPVPASAGSDVPTSEPAQEELSKIDPQVAHVERTLVAEPESTTSAVEGAPVSPIAAPATAAHARRMSIPIPERDSSYHEEDAQQRLISSSKDLGHHPHHHSLPTATPVHEQSEEDEKKVLEPSKNATILGGVTASLAGVGALAVASHKDDDDEGFKDPSPPLSPPPRATRPLPVPPPAAPPAREESDTEEAEAGEPAVDPAVSGPESEPEEEEEVVEEEVPVEEEQQQQDVDEEDEAARPLPPPPPPPPRPSAGLPPPPVNATAASVYSSENEATGAVETDAEEAADAEAEDSGPNTMPAPPEQEDEEAATGQEDKSDASLPPLSAGHPVVSTGRPPVPKAFAASTTSTTDEPKQMKDAAEAVPAPPALPAGRHSSAPATSLPTPATAREEHIVTPAVTAAAAAPKEEKDEQSPADEMDEEQARRQTIAARMAKLSGGNPMRLFGGPPPMPPVRKPTAEAAANREATEAEGATTEAAAPPEEQQQPQEDEEDDEEAADKARRARALAKMQKGGFGMVMGGYGVARPQMSPPAPVEEPERTDKDEIVPPSAPAPTTTLKTPVEEGPLDLGDSSGRKTSGQSFSREEDEEEAAPPPPPRQQRPPVPSTRSIVESQQSAESAPPANVLPPAPQAEEDDNEFPADAAVATAYTAEPEEDDNLPPPPPPSRPARGLPPIETSTGQQQPTESLSPLQSTGPAPATEVSPIEHGARRPSLDDQSHGLISPTSGGGLQRGPPSRGTSATIPEVPHQGGAGGNLGQRELIELSKTVGAAVARNADSLVSQSKKAVIADGTSLGFVTEVLYISHAAAPTSSSTFGHLVFHQSGGDLLSRRDDIRAGDIVVLDSCHFKGKKGLVSYQTDVARNVGVVLEFEEKKSKAHVAQASGKANHYPSLDSVNYRLEDLKNGEVKVFRPTPGA